MRKTKNKKSELHLKRETIRMLTDQSLSQVVGASPEPSESKTTCPECLSG